jgi:transposase
MLMKEVGKGSVIVMDNAGFHRKEKLAEVAEKCELVSAIRLISLIEHFWSLLKKKYAKLW